MSEPAITPEQVKLAMEAAGLDPNRPLNEQLSQVKRDDVAEQVARIEQRLDELVAAQNPDPQPDPQQGFASQYASALHSAQSRWFNPDGSDAPQ